MYKIYLTDPFVALNDKMYKEISALLQGYFTKITAKLKKPDTAEIVWTKDVPTLAADEVFVYFTAPEFSVASQFTGKPSPAQRAGAWGFTTPKQGDDRVGPWASEVYVRQLNSNALGKIAFHEIMHNKMRQFNDELHKKNGLAIENIDWEKHDISPENITDMAKALRNPTPQWTGGIQIMRTAKVMRDAGTLDWNVGAF